MRLDICRTSADCWCVTDLGRGAPLLGGVEPWTGSIRRTKRKPRALVVTKDARLVFIYSKYLCDRRLGHLINGAPTIRADCSIDALARARGCEEFAVAALLRTFRRSLVIDRFLRHLGCLGRIDGCRGEH